MAATKDSVTPVTRERVPWRSIGVGVTTVGTPTGLAMLHPMLGVILGGTEVVVALQIMTTALYGSSILSERAFRLLRWIGNQPEPSAPAPGDLHVPRHRNHPAGLVRRQCSGPGAGRSSPKSK